MPELPEVETIRSGLEKSIVGKVISSIWIGDYLPNISGGLLKNQVGTKFVKAGRRAKFLFFDLSNGKSLIVHLKMTGQFIPCNDASKIKSNSTRVIFDFDDSSSLVFNDTRKFGFIKIIDSDEVEGFFASKGIGPEPLDENFTFENFISVLAKKSRSRIKPTLMDQKVIAGIGNIYAAEGCFYAKVLPQRKIETISREELKLLYRGIREILSKAIEFNGTSFDEAYVTAKGVPGEFSKFLQVYGQDSCKSCNTTLEDLRLNSRSSKYCPNCQK